MNEPPKILIAGIGNIFHGDDAFGVELAQRLLRREQPAGVRVFDFGIRGLDLAYALMDDPPVAILLDTTSRGGAPGTLYTIEITDADIPETSTLEPALETHALNPARVLQMVKRMGGSVNRTFLIGCEPFTFGTDEEGALGLSPVMRESIDPAVVLVEALVAKLLHEPPSNRSETHAVH